MKKIIEKYGFVKIFAFVFGLWIINFVQSYIEGWTGFYDMHWYNHVLMVPGYIILAFGTFNVGRAVVFHWIIAHFKKLFKKKS